LGHLQDFEGIVLVDIDNSIIRSTVALPKLPKRAGEILYKTLKEILNGRVFQRDLVKPLADAFDFDPETPRSQDSCIYQAVLTFYSLVFGDYRRFLFKVDGTAFLNENGFLRSKPEEDGTKDFLSRAVQTMMFDQYIQEESVFKEPDLFHVFLVLKFF
jgi:hypothetical protein